MYENSSSLSSSSVDILTLSPLGLSSIDTYPAFLFGTLTYFLVLFCNLLVLATIIVTRKLHKPMFILLFNLCINDTIGATAFFPQILLSMATKSRLISYPACVIQAFLLHVYGTANLLTLTSMAYDRYIAICFPLRYNAILNLHNLIKIIFFIWFIDFATMFTLFMLLVRFKICRKNLVDLFCNNPSLVKLVCDDTSVNNLYGLLSIIILQAGPLLVICYTYAQILRTCIMTNNTNARQKAIQTCGTHLVIFLVLQINTVFTLISHRIQNMASYLRRCFGVSVLIFPPILDPIIYGLNTRELKQSIITFLKRNVVSTKQSLFQFGFIF